MFFLSTVMSLRVHTNTDVTSVKLPPASAFDEEGSRQVSSAVNEPEEDRRRAQKKNVAIDCWDGENVSMFEAVKH
jgi:hypothetical protein